MDKYRPINIGIHVDNYKIKTFEKELKVNGFIASSKPFSKDTSFFTILTRHDRLDDIRKLCQKCQIDCKLSN